jgi:hypothetical protein
MSFLEKSRAAGRNRGRKVNREEIVREFASYPQERRAAILDELDAENHGAPDLTQIEAGKLLDDRKTVADMRRAHHVLRKQGR